MKDEIICMAGQGKIIPLDKHEYYSFMNANEGKEVVITKRKKKRSNNANRYYWWCVDFVCKITTELYGDRGYKPEELHELALRELAGVVKGDGQIVAGRSSTMTKERFAQYVNDFKVWSQQTFDILYIPESSEVYQ